MPGPKKSPVLKADAAREITEDCIRSRPDKLLEAISIEIRMAAAVGKGMVVSLLESSDRTYAKELMSRLKELGYEVQSFISAGERIKLEIYWYIPKSAKVVKG